MGRLSSIVTVNEPNMLISDVIRDAVSEHEIYFLLTAYVDAVRYGDKPSALPGTMRDLPFVGVEDVRARVLSLQCELAKPLLETRIEDRSVVQEAMHIFRLALSRLEALESQPGERLAA